MPEDLFPPSNHSLLGNTLQNKQIIKYILIFLSLNILISCISAGMWMSPKGLDLVLPSVRPGSACCPVFRINIAPSTGITAELRIDCSSSFTPSFNFFLRFRSGFVFSNCKKVRAIYIKHCVYKKLFYFNYILLRKDTYSIRDVSTSSLDKNKLPSKQNHNWLKKYLK